MENEILQLLRRTPGTRYSHKEIGRTLDRRQYRDDCHWARPVLERLVGERVITKDDCLYFWNDTKSEEGSIPNRSFANVSSASGSAETIELADETDELKPERP
jgi:hypothetical protein